MDLAPIARTAVSDTIFGRLVEEILTGRLPAGEPLPSERELSLTLQVNRHAVREALKRLQQAGLVRISHGGKTRVLNWRTSAGLDALTGLAAAGVIPTQQIIGDVAVMRRSIAADAARLCARGASPEQRAAITTAAAAYPASGELELVLEADLTFWIAVIDGSGNIAYRLALNTLTAAFEDMGREAIYALGAAEFADRSAHLDLAAAIAAADEDTAYRLAEELLTRFVNACQNWER
ncbi:GntR family transcriptional regulator [Mycolicibacter sp. MYC123]|uniref:GntR family transcriptional regulator n=1 Tax=[Mycobacterium] zoologicum TaxID=2872311 RepID=A0ABU5YN94_9MYCO|nr:MULTISPECIES: GntR family transcriptional regulator [unclassified Mycolicibacter]MEB3051530.1 GntR family transcriptional regulator [Mycolicibacter sp. MYC123]MEB3061352.1 GntR family transcriptional regulator [Mycolicibacter sp. MYC101]